MRMTSKGQVTIPVNARRQLGLGPGHDLEFTIVGDAVQIRKAAGEQQGHGRRVVEALRGRGGASGMSTDEIMALTRGDD